MKKMGAYALAAVMVATYVVASCAAEDSAPTPEKIGLRVLYVGYPGTSREKDFVSFLEKHFAKVGRGGLDKFQEKDADGFDVVIMDYSGLTIKGNAIITPRVPFDRTYTRPVMTIGAAGALVCDSLGLKTGYL